MTKEEVKIRQRELSQKVMSLSIGTLMLNMRYMSKAISKLSPIVYEGSYACNGISICFDPSHLLRRYSENEKLPVHDCLHMLLHCVFRHWHTGKGIDRLRWDAACDIAVESIIQKIAKSFCTDEGHLQRAAVIKGFELNVEPLTAEKLYAYFENEGTDEDKLKSYIRMFSTDDHKEWYPNDKKEYEDEEEPPFINPDIKENENDEQGDRKDNDGGSGDDSKQNDEINEIPDKPEVSDSDESRDYDEGLQNYLENERQRQQEQLEEQWKELAKEIKSELEDFGKSKSDESSYLVQLLERLERERVDYTEFLKRFAVPCEEMRADLDSFEPAFYSYGLRLYGNVALIEPPEYKESRLIRDFVIAIDTSGSVSGKLVQRFMQKTYNILKSTESFNTNVNIYILQCDTEVRDAVKITSEQELERYIAKTELKGLGGTDFVPVFEYISHLQNSGQLSELKGLIYFTDGLGSFPDKKPPYDVAFAFIGESEAVTPPWAIKLELEEEDI